MLEWAGCTFCLDVPFDKWTRYVTDVFFGNAQFTWKKLIKTLEFQPINFPFVFLSDLEYYYWNIDMTKNVVIFFNLVTLNWNATRVIDTIIWYVLMCPLTLYETRYYKTASSAGRNRRAFVRRTVRGKHHGSCNYPRSFCRDAISPCFYEATAHACRKYHNVDRVLKRKAFLLFTRDGRWIMNNQTHQTYDRIWLETKRESLENDNKQLERNSICLQSDVKFDILFLRPIKISLKRDRRSNTLSSRRAMNLATWLQFTQGCHKIYSIKSNEILCWIL